jgi:hypothetical protein
MIKIVAIHLGLDEMPVNLLGNRPFSNLKAIELGLQTFEHLVTLSESLCRVVRRTVQQRRRFEFAPFGKQLQKVVVRVLLRGSLAGEEE